MDRELSSKDKEIERRTDPERSWTVVNCFVTGQQKEIETLKETIANLTKQLADKDKEQVRLNSSLSSLRDELEVGRFSLFFYLFMFFF